MAKKQKKYTPEGKKASLAVKYAATFPRFELIFVTSAFQSVTQCCTFAMMSSGRSPAARLFAGAFFVCVPVAYLFWAANVIRVKIIQQKRVILIKDPVHTGGFLRWHDAPPYATRLLRERRESTGYVWSLEKDFCAKYGS